MTFWGGLVFGAIVALLLKGWWQGWVDEANRRPMKFYKHKGDGREFRLDGMATDSTSPMSNLYILFPVGRGGWEVWPEADVLEQLEDYVPELIRRMQR